MLPNLGMIPGASDIIADIVEALGVANPRGKYIEGAGNNEHYPVTLNGFRLPFEPMVSLRGGRKLENAEIPGRNSTVKQDTGEGDWRITLSTFLANTMRPLISFNEIRNWDKDLGEIRKLLRGAGAMTMIQGAPKKHESLLSVNHIERVFFENINLDMVEGNPHVIMLSMTFLSDEDVELIINE